MKLWPKERPDGEEFVQERQENTAKNRREGQALPLRHLP
jgi:hypothetical protein